MAIIPKQNEIDVFVNQNGTVTIKEVEGYFNQENGEVEDALITIDPVHIDVLIAALQTCKAEAIELSGQERGNG